MVNLSQFGSVPGDLLSNANYTISILNEIFAAFPVGYFRFTSGYRSPERNAAVNGVDNSFHIKALAGDFVPVNGSYPYSDLESIGQIVSKYGFEVIKHDVGSGLHYHIEPSPNWNGQTSLDSNSNILPILGFLLLIFLID